MGSCDDGPITDEVLARQADYYRHRAGEYDATAYGGTVAANARIARLVREMHLGGEILEVACGTGIWTDSLADVAQTITAIDVASEVLAIARERVSGNNVRFEVADIFCWETERRFDVIFFSAWLSHVPTDRFERFWQTLRGLLADDGRVLFVDEPIELRNKERYLVGSDEIVERRLRDGKKFQLVKNFIDPVTLTNRLRGLGWDCQTWRDHGDWVWICGEACPLSISM